MTLQGYDYTAADLATLILRRFYPEKTDRESTIIRDWLLAHGHEYDRFAFSVRIGTPQPVTADTNPAVAASVARSSRKRIDVLAWQGNAATIVEIKERVTPHALGQVLTYRHLFLEEFPDAADPRLLVVGRTSDPDTIRSLSAHGVDVLLYEAPFAR